MLSSDAWAGFKFPATEISESQLDANHDNLLTWTRTLLFTEPSLGDFFDSLTAVVQRVEMLLDLPSEILVLILKEFHTPDLVRCTQVCRPLKQLINTLPDLLLKIELHVSGRELLRHNHLPPVNDLLVELQSRVGSRTQSTLELKHEDSIEINEPIADWEFNGNVFVQFQRTNHLSGLVDVFHINSTLESMPTWSWELLGDLWRWTFDPSKDVFFGIVVVSRENAENPGIDAYNLHILKLSTGEPHPEAASHILPLLVGRMLASADPAGIACSFCEDILVLGILPHSKVVSSQNVAVLNWKTGHICHRFRWDAIDLCLLSEKVLLSFHLVGDRNHRSMKLGLSVHELEINELQPGHESTSLSQPSFITPTHRVTFLLPEMKRIFMHRAGLSYSRPIDRATVYPSSSYDQHIAVDSTAELLVVHTGSQILRNCGFVMHPRFLRNWQSFVSAFYGSAAAGISSSASGFAPLIIPWDNWGPQNTRFMSYLQLINSGDVYGYTVATHTHLFDFNPVSIRRDLCRIRNCHEMVQREQEAERAEIEGRHLMQAPSQYATAASDNMDMDWEQWTASYPSGARTVEQVHDDSLSLFENLSNVEIPLSMPSSSPPRPSRPRSHASEMLATLSQGLVNLPTTLLATGDSGFTRDVTTSLPYRSSSFGGFHLPNVGAVLCDEDLHFIQDRRGQPPSSFIIHTYSI